MLDLEVAFTDVPTTIARGKTMEPSENVTTAASVPELEQYKIHPLANLFPMMSEEEITSLAEDIKKNGQRFGIIKVRGEIIDGRNRLMACMKLNIAPVIVDRSEVLTDERKVMEFIISANMERRHLNASERACIANEILKKQEEVLSVREGKQPTPAPEPVEAETPEEATEAEVQEPEAAEEQESSETEQEEGPKPPRDKTKRVEAVAQKTGTSPAYVHAAGRLEKTDPEKYEEVKSGKKTISQANKEIEEEGGGPKLTPEKAQAKALKLVEKVQVKLEELGFKLVNSKIVKL